MKITWSDLARQTFLSTLEYLEKEWGQKEAIEFNTEVDITLELLKTQPQMFPETDMLGIRRCVLRKQMLLLYSVSDFEIRLMTFWDTRQNPKRLIV